MRIRSETVANVAITVMCIAVTGVLVERYVVPRFVASSDPAEYREGDRLIAGMRGLVDTTASVTAVLVVSQNCKYCRESVDFYQRLVAKRSEGTGGRFQTVFIGFNENDAKDFLAKSNLPADTLRPSPPDLRERVKATPTVLIVDATGLVMASFTGKLNDIQERNVFATVSAIRAARVTEP